MAVPKTKPVLNAADALIDRFIEHFRLPPTSRRDIIGRFHDLLGVVDAEVGWDLMEKTLDDDSDEGMSHLKRPGNILVPFALADAACGASPTLKARGELMTAVGQEVYTHTLRAWGASASNLKPGKAPVDIDPDEKIQTAPPPKKETDDVKAGPFSESYKGSPDQRAQAIGALVTSLGTRAVVAMARNSGRDLAGRVLRK
jgi:hypothetical protein